MNRIPYPPRRKPDGFTLVELLVVVIIMSILSAIAVPELLKQVEKGRQSEAKTILGSINRAQQAYRLEHATFALLEDLPVRVPELKYYDVIDDDTTIVQADPFGASQKAVSKIEYTNDIRDFASAVGQTSSGVFKALICQAYSPNDDFVSTLNNSGDVRCENGTPVGAE